MFRHERAPPPVLNETKCESERTVVGPCSGEEHWHSLLLSSCDGTVSVALLLVQFANLREHGSRFRSARLKQRPAVPCIARASVLLA
jgi:hypothetical protein